MMRRLGLFVALLLLVLPTAPALAHGGPKEGANHLFISAGKDPVILDFATWPLQAKVSNRILVAPTGGPEGKTATLKLTPADPAVAPIEQTLETFPGVTGAWVFETAGLPAGGTWTLDVTITGPNGTATGSSGPLSVSPPPRLPMWFGWLLGLFPLYGLVWFGIRERRRVKSLLAA